MLKWESLTVSTACGSMICKQGSLNCKTKENGSLLQGGRRASDTYPMTDFLLATPRVNAQKAIKVKLGD